MAQIEAKPIQARPYSEKLFEIGFGAILLAVELAWLVALAYLARTMLRWLANV